MGAGKRGNQSPARRCGPLLLVRARPPEGLQSPARLATVLVALDGSAVAEQALPHAQALARVLGLGLTLMTVTPLESAYHEAWLDGVTPARQAALVDEEAGRYLDAVGDRLRTAGAQATPSKVLRGDAAEAILKVASESPGCLVVMTSHGRSGVGRWLLGSVADRVVRHSPAPVLRCGPSPRGFAPKPLESVDSRRLGGLAFLSRCPWADEIPHPD
ncbi:MAG: universal stress protein, partial [SAR202 cluster bacterium]|nr:universal stress protein [SAR202 cluster bacterium]